MKKILIILSFTLSIFAMAQDVSDNQYVYDNNDEVSEDGSFPGSPGDPNTAPIDDYIPVLFVIGAAFAIRFSLRNKPLTKNL